MEPAVASSRRNLDDVGAQLTTHAAAQEAGDISSRGETAKQRALRSTRRNDRIGPIAETATQNLGDVPELDACVMAATNATPAQVVAHAVAMPGGAKKHEQVFKEIGLPDDVLTDLQSVTAEVSQPIDDRKQHAGKRSGATAELEWSPEFG